MILHGDALTMLQTLPTESANMAITSPLIGDCATTMSPASWGWKQRMRSI